MYHFHLANMSFVSLQFGWVTITITWHEPYPSLEFVHASIQKTCKHSKLSHQKFFTNCRNVFTQAKNAVLLYKIILG